MNANIAFLMLGGIIRDRVSGKQVIDPVQVGGRLRALFEVLPGVRGIVVLDAHANVIAATPSDLLGRNFSQRPYLTVPRQGGDTTMLYITPPFRSIPITSRICCIQPHKPQTCAPPAQ